MRTRRLRRGQAAAVALALALGWVGGAVTSGRLGDSSSRRAPTVVRGERAGVPSGAVARGGPGPGSAPSGFPRSEAGARAAALSYAGAPQRWLYLSDAEVEAEVRAIAVPGAADRLAEEVVGEVALAREALAASSGRVWWIVRPLATRVDRYGERSARVAVWTVTVLSATEVALPQADWLTVTVDLEWGGDGWRVGAVDDAVGPTPMTGVRDEPWPAGRFDEVLAGFVRVGAEEPG